MATVTKVVPGAAAASGMVGVVVIEVLLFGTPATSGGDVTEPGRRPGSVLCRYVCARQPGPERGRIITTA